MGKKRRPPTKSSNVIHSNAAAPSSVNTNHSASNNNSSSGVSHSNNNNNNGGPSVTASMNGISLPPAIANQILAAMSRSAAVGVNTMNMNVVSGNNNNSSGGNNNNNGGNTNSGAAPPGSKQYLDEMGKLIAAHMNQSTGNNFGVRFTGGGSIPHSSDGKTMYGPAPPPPSNGNPIQNLQQFLEKNHGSATAATASVGGSTFSFTAGGGSAGGGGNTTKSNYNTNNPEDIKTMMNLFTELMGLSSTAATTGSGGGNEVNTTSQNHHSFVHNNTANHTPTNEELAREFYEKFIADNNNSNTTTPQQSAMLQNTDPLALRKAAFAAGVNVAMQQQLLREEKSKKDLLYNKNGSKSTSANENVTAGAGMNSNTTTANLQPVFSMIFGNDGATGGNHMQGVAAGGGGNIPPIPPPPNGWPAGASAAAAAAAFASTLTMKDNGGGNNTTNNNNTTQYYNPADFAGAFSSPELGSPAWLEYYFEEYARTAAAAASRSNLPQDRPKSNVDTTATDNNCPSHFEYYDEEERLMRERRIILEATKEEAERQAKAAKKKDKKARKKERAKREAEAKSVAAAKKKREKTITSWRSRVVAACTSGDVTKMEVLLSESPYKNFVYDPAVMDEDNASIISSDEEEDDNTDGNRRSTKEEYLIRQLDWFFPNVLQKYPELEPGKIPFEKNGARELLAKYIMNTSFDTVCLPGPNSMRNAIHNAAYRNDVNFIKWVIDGKMDAFMKQAESCEDGEELENPYCECLDILCEDAGWSSLHYAVASGSVDVVEALLEADQFLTTTRSDLELTCLNSTGYGITARELAHVLQSGAIHEDISCDGDVLDEIVEDRIVCATTSEKNAYMKTLRLLTERLEDVEINGYSPLQKADEQSKSTVKNSSKSESQTAAASKKSKKKKKKQQQQQNASSAPSPNLSAETEKKKESKPNPANAPEDDLSDPVAVALLGMGFTAEQITSAAKALGGFDRATADDMVMWILSGGQVNNDEQEEQQQDVSNEFDDSQHSEPMTLSDVSKKVDTKAKLDSEELARKRQEKIAAAERAAAKREEQRRIRREWNEREQARQEIEKNAKIAEVVAKKKQAEIQKMQAELAASNPLPAIPPTVHVGGGKGKSKSGTGPPQTIVAGGKKGSSASNMGIPKGPNVKAPKILARPNQVLPGAQQGGASTHPLFPGQTSNVLPSANQQAASKPRNLSQSRQQQPLPPPPASYTHQTLPNMPSTTYYNHSSASSSFGYDSTYGKDVGAMPLLSGGSNYHSGQHGNVPPPGFNSSVLPPSPTTNDSTLNAAANPLGEIRATAREFVPTSFAPVHESAPSGLEFNAVPSMSSQPTTVSHPSHPDSRSNSNEVSLLLDPVSSLLNAGISAPVTKSDSPVQSATSSITGFSGTVEEATTSRVGSALTFESAVGGIQTSSILESITYSGGQESNIGGLGSVGIWGDSNNNQSANLGGLVGLNFSSFLNGGDQKNDGQSSSQGNTWGTSTGGSIW